MRKQPKTAPMPALLVLFPFVAIMAMKEFITWTIDTVWDGLQRLGPRFQGFVLGVWAGFALFMFAVSLAIFS